MLCRKIRSALPSSGGATRSGVFGLGAMAQVGRFDEHASSDPAHDDQVRDIESISILGLRSVLCIPLKEREEVVGAIYLDNRLARRAFGDEDLRMLEAFADHVVVALRNSRLFAEAEQSRMSLEEARARVEALNEKLEAIVRGQSLELEELRDAFRTRKTLGTRHQYREIIGRMLPFSIRPSRLLPSGLIWK